MFFNTPSVVDTMCPNFSARKAECKERCIPFNDHERKLWVDNDEFLHNCFRAGSHNNLSRFVRENRDVIDAVIVANLT